MSRASRVPRDPNLPPEMRKFHDEIERRSQYIDVNGNADFTTVSEGGNRAFIQNSNATKGLDHTPKDHGTVTTGTTTITPRDGFHQKLTCGGAITIAPASIDYYASVSLHIINNASAGTKTLSGMSPYTGSAGLTNTDGDEFNVLIYWFGSSGVDYMVFKRP